MTGRGMGIKASGFRVAQGLCLLWLTLVIVVVVVPCRAVDIRLSEGVDRPPSPPASETQSSLQIPKRVHSQAVGPPLLLASQGECITTTSGDYEYAVCLFRNVTQRKPTDRFKINVGTWSRWRAEESPEGGGRLSYFMLYTDGDTCTGNKSRTATVKILCDSSDFTLSRIQEPYTCDYTMDLAVPLPCSDFTPNLATSTTASTSTTTTTTNTGASGISGTGRLESIEGSSASKSTPRGLSSERSTTSEPFHPPPPPLPTQPPQAQSVAPQPPPPPPPPVSVPSHRIKPARLLARCRQAKNQGETCEAVGGHHDGDKEEEAVEDCLLDELDKISQQVISFKSQVMEEVTSIKKSIAELRSLLIDNLPHDYPEAAS